MFVRFVVTYNCHDLQQNYLVVSTIFVYFKTHPLDKTEI